MDLGSIIALMKLLQDTEIAKPATRDLYAKETALQRAEEGGLGL